VWCDAFRLIIISGLPYGALWIIPLLKLFIFRIDTLEIKLINYRGNFSCY
jgi:hypothetical protein